MNEKTASIPGAPDESGVLNNLPIRVSFDPRYQQGHLHLTMEAATIAIDGKEVGSIMFCIGGGLELNDARTKKSWYLGLNEIWAAFESMLAENASNTGSELPLGDNVTTSNDAESDATNEVI
jgi:hypothetical protein